jgi:rhodanese-related sulfurtransferase
MNDLPHVTFITKQIVYYSDLCPQYMFMRKTLFILFLLLFTVSLFTRAQTVKQMDAQNFEMKLKATKGPILLDVRTPAEYASGHIAGATELDYYSKDFKAGANKLDKTKPVFVYCASGVRSNAAVGVLKDLGFKEIYDLRGGIRSWAQSGKATIK